MAENKEAEIFWPSGDCIPVLGTELTPEVLSDRFRLAIFRARDDLDWFTGAVVNPTSVGPLLVMKHDHNPRGLTAFYVDGRQDVVEAQSMISQKFSLKKSEIAWLREALS